jgi:hypothetical protein
MIVVGHKAVSADAQGKQLDSFMQNIDKALIVVFRLEYSFPTSSTVHHVIPCVWILYSKRPGHIKREQDSVYASRADLIAPFFLYGNKRMRVVPSKSSREDLLFLKEVIEAGKLFPVIDRRYPLSETAEALRYLGQGHARGKVVITMAA